MEERKAHKRKETMRISDIGIIELTGMEFHAYHGCFEKEREEGNLFVVDFRLNTTTRRRRSPTGSTTPSITATSTRSSARKWTSRRT